MKFITDVKELEGKTIKLAAFVGFGHDLAIIFNDDTYTCISCMQGELGIRWDIDSSIVPDLKNEIMELAKHEAEE